MIIVPGSPPLQETRHSRELSRRIEDAVRDYQRANPEMTDAEVRTALLQLVPGGRCTRHRPAEASCGGRHGRSRGGRLHGNSESWRQVQQPGVAPDCWRCCGGGRPRVRSYALGTTRLTELRAPRSELRGWLRELWPEL